ncbi:MAG TPA: helix-turn-helix domain-containing protein [Thermoanaerobaculia bacterium]
MPVRPSELEWIMNRGQAISLLEPLRAQILGLARQPASATEIAARLGLPRQRVNYHVRELSRTGLLRRAGRRRRRNMFEQRYVASAHGYILLPELLGFVRADWRQVSDAGSAAYLAALTEQMQSDVARAARALGKKVSSVAIKSQFRFDSAEQRERFTRELQNAVVAVIARFTSPNLGGGGAPGAGRPYRLVLGCYPYAAESAAASSQKPA